MRIGINVPNELIKQVKAIDLEVNVSQICREALKSYVSEAGRITERVTSDGMDEHALRLAQAYEYPIVDPDWVGYALDDARDWVSTVEPEEWERFFSLYDFLKARGDELTNMQNHTSGPDGGPVRGYHYWYKKHEDWFEWKYDVGNEDVHKNARGEYERAWLGYVEKVREKQLQHIEEERQRVMAERRKAWKARPEPEVPPQLLG